MATPARHLCRSLFQASRRLPVKRKWRTECLHGPQRIPPFRQFSSTSFRAASTPPSDQPAPPAEAESKTTSEDSEELDEQEIDQDLRKYAEEHGELAFEMAYPKPPDPADYLTPSEAIAGEDLSQGEIDAMNELLGGAPGDPVGLYNHLMAVAESLDAEKDLDPAVMQAYERDLDTEDDLDFPPDVLARKDVGYHADDEDVDEFAMAEDDDDESDPSAITSVALSELEVHREIREYTRVVAWDMPLLTNFAKEFKPPAENQVLRFRYTTYMGETHPAAKKVVVQFSPNDIPGLTDAQRQKLIKLVGPRYNPDTEVVKISSEKFEAPAQNKRYLGDLVNKLVDEAKNGSDKLADIPVDFRHHKAKPKPRFPEEWKLKPERVQALMSARKEQRLLAAAASVKPPDGQEFVHEYVQSLGVKATPLHRIV